MKYCIAGGLVLTLLLSVLGWFYSGPVTALVVLVACTLAAKSVANRLHGMLVVQHEMHGGELGSWKMVVWLSLGICVLLVAIEFVIKMALLIAYPNG
jgi:hypothetical protein